MSEFKPELIQAISRDDYVALKGPDGIELERQSNAKHAADSAWHYYMHCMNPDRPKRNETDYMLRGTLVHEVALEDKIRFASFNGTRRGKAWENFKLKCEHENLISVSEDSGTINRRDIMGAAESVKRALEELGADADSECAAVFEQEGLYCKALLDSVSTDLAIYDIKVTDKIGKTAFGYHAFDMGYDFQCVWYKRGLKQAVGMMDEPMMVFITVEPTYPYDWNWHILEGNGLEIAEKRVDRAVENLRTARETGCWDHEEREVNVIVPSLRFLDDNL